MFTYGFVVMYESYEYTSESLWIQLGLQPFKNKYIKIKGSQHSQHKWIEILRKVLVGVFAKGVLVFMHTIFSCDI